MTEPNDSETPQPAPGGFILRTADGLTAWGDTPEAATEMVALMRRERAMAEG